MDHSGASEETAASASVTSAVCEDGPEPAWTVPAPVQEAPATLASQPAPVREALAPLRERLFQAQERLASLELSAPVQELPVRRADEDAPGLLYALLSFLREAEDLSETCDDLASPHPSMLPVAATPRRRLHLA